MSYLQLIDISDDGFVFDSRTGESYSVNYFGKLVLQGVKEGKSLQEIADFICGDFGIPPSVAQRDVADFFGQLNLFGIGGIQK